MNSSGILLCLTACFTIAMCNRVYVHPFHLFFYNQSDCEKMEKENQTVREEKTFTPTSIGSKTTAEEDSLRDRLTLAAQSLSPKDHQKESYLIALVNNLGFYLFDGLKKMRKSETVLLSPTNLFGSLVSFYLGASKDTANDLQKLMGFPSGGPNCTSRVDGHIVFSSLKAIDSLLLRKGVNVDASKMVFLFVASGVPLFETFVYDLLPSANSLFVRAVAFSDPAQATEEINSFFSGKISKNGQPLLTSVDASTNLQYASYTHFKGKVHNALPVAGYQDFWIDSSRKVQVPMMSVTGTFQFKHDDRENYFALRVPISENDFLLLVQPTHGNSLEKLESKLTFNSYSSFFANLANRYVHLTLPKIVIESSYDLQDILAQINLTYLFGKKADFSKISDADIKVGKVRAHLPASDETAARIEIYPGDVILYKRFRRVSSLDVRWEGPALVLLVTPTAVKVAGKTAWVYRSHLKRLPDDYQSEEAKEKLFGEDYTSLKPEGSSEKLMKPADSLKTDTNGEGTISPLIDLQRRYNLRPAKPYKV